MGDELLESQSSDEESGDANKKADIAADAAFKKFQDAQAEGKKTPAQLRKLLGTALTLRRKQLRLGAPSLEELFAKLSIFEQYLEFPPFDGDDLKDFEITLKQAKALLDKSKPAIDQPGNAAQKEYDDNRLEYLLYALACHKAMGAEKSVKTRTAQEIAALVAIIDPKTESPLTQEAMNKAKRWLPKPEDKRKDREVMTLDAETSPPPVPSSPKTQPKRKHAEIVDLDNAEDAEAPSKKPKTTASNERPEEEKTTGRPRKAKTKARQKLQEDADSSDGEFPDPTPAKKTQQKKKSRSKDKQKQKPRSKSTSQSEPVVSTPPAAVPLPNFSFTIDGPTFLALTGIHPESQEQLNRLVALCLGRGLAQERLDRHMDALFTHSAAPNASSKNSDSSSSSSAQSSSVFQASAASPHTPVHSTTALGFFPPAAPGRNPTVLATDDGVTPSAPALSSSSSTTE